MATKNKRKTSKSARTTRALGTSIDDMLPSVGDPKEPLTNITARVPQWVVDELDAIAKRGSNRGEVIRDLLTWALGQYKKRTS